MTKQQVMIEVDVPEGWEIDRFGLPKAGEHWIDGVGKLNCAGFDYQDTACVIVRKAWQWPDWLKGWIAMDEDGAWFWFENEPRQMNTGWGHEGGEYYRFDVVTNVAGIQPPPCTDWRTSKRRRPT